MENCDCCKKIKEKKRNSYITRLIIWRAFITTVCFIFLISMFRSIMNSHYGAAILFAMSFGYTLVYVMRYVTEETVEDQKGLT